MIAIYRDRLQTKHHPSWMCFSHLIMIYIYVYIYIYWFIYLILLLLIIINIIYNYYTYLYSRYIIEWPLVWLATWSDLKLSGAIQGDVAARSSWARHDLSRRHSSWRWLCWLWIRWLARSPKGSWRNPWMKACLKMMKDDERWWKMMKDDERWWKMMKDDERW